MTQATHSPSGPVGSDILHIASFVVLHQPAAVARLDARLATLDGTELVLREGGRSVVLCEGSDERALLDAMESLRDLEGVFGVTLVHHHQEARAALLEEISDAHTP